MKKSHLLILLLGVGMVANTIAAPPQVPLTVTVQGDGVVTSDPAGITCPGDCDKSYKKKSTITLTATADPDGVFLGWSGACSGTQPSCEILLKDSSMAYAFFDILQAPYCSAALGSPFYLW